MSAAATAPRRAPALRATVVVAMLGAFLAGCAVPRSDGVERIALPLQRAWFEGRVVEYVTTDVSDAAVAREKGANYVPRLADTLPDERAPRVPGGARGGAPVERVYSFAGRHQFGVFPSAPRPAGHDNADAAYSPLWRMVVVHWNPGRTVRELRSEEAVLAAEERGDVRLEITRIVLNCPVVRAADGTALRDVR
jgi:hypothetical protein